MSNLADPIFVHASARGGSSYFFNVLRRSEHLLCFSSAIIDGKRDIAHLSPAQKRGAARLSPTQTWDINHHFLDRPDFHEFIEAWDAVMHLCPDCPTFRDYLPEKGILSAELSVYFSALIAYAHSRGKRPVLCETNSRGRAGALRGEFGGFHVAQYRDPLSQFGSFIRAVIDAGFWGFLSHPVTELGTSRGHPLYRIVPEAWSAPDLPWRAENRAQRWASDAEYIVTVASPRPETMEKIFRWHMFSWVLSNLAAVSYSDLVVDMDKIHDDSHYRTSVISTLDEVGVTADFSDLKKFDRYYQFESFDVTSVCDQVVSTVRNALEDGRVELAVQTLGRQFPVTSPSTAVELLLAKIRDSQASMKNSSDCHYISATKWKEIAEKNRKIWFNPGIRRFARHIYPVAVPFVHAARRAGLFK